MKDYYDLFVKLSLQQCTESDYADKVKVRRHNAASFCLQWGILVGQSVQTLKKAADTSGDRTIRLSAEMLPQKYQ